MKIANFINNNGEKILISSYNNMCDKYLDRLICPYCNEKVDWINGKKQEKHFRHHHSTYSEKCENYCDSISTGTCIQPYEYEGIQIYLIKEFGKYSLALGLFGLSEETIQEAEDIGLEIEIDGYKNLKVRRKVNFESFVPHKINFIALNCVNQQYKLTFSKSNIPMELKNKWISSINGIGNEGAIFTSGEYGGKKVSSLTGLQINEEYILLTNKNIRCNIDGIILNEPVKIIIGWARNYQLYKFVVKKINKETLTFCRSFDMGLHFSNPEIIPIWPPCSVLEEELIYSDKKNKYFVLNTDNENEKMIYSYELQRELFSEKINKSKYLTSLGLKIDDVISIGNLNKQFIYSIINRKIEKVDEDPSVMVELDQNKLIINTNVKVFVNHFNKDVLIKSSIIKKEASSEINFRRNENIEILHGLECVWTQNDNSKIPNLEEIDKLDEVLLYKIKNCKGEAVILPDSFKWMTLRYKKYKQVYIELHKIIRKNSAPADLINLLMRY